MPKNNMLVCTQDNHYKVSLLALKHDKGLQETTNALIHQALKGFNPSPELKQKMIKKLRAKERRVKKSIDTARRQ